MPAINDLRAIKNVLRKTNPESGQAMMVAVLLFVTVSVVIIFGLASPVLKHQRVVSQAHLSGQSYFLAEAGVEDVVYRLKNGQPVDAAETLTLDGYSVTTLTADTPDGKEIIATGNVKDAIRKVKTSVTLGSGVSFHFGVQSGEGGLIMENTSSISGNVYSNGPVSGSGPTNNTIRGGVVSAGPEGIISNLYATSSAFAHTIDNSRIDGDAYYEDIVNPNVGGTLYPGSPDLSPAPLPIPDSQIEEWKQAALDGGTISSPCPYKITDETTLGPTKIACDLEISGNNYAVTLTGPVWVEGDVTIFNSPTIRIDPSFGNKGVPIVAHNPLSPDTSGKIDLQNSAIFEGSGEFGSHVMLVSQNQSAESGGNEVAITVRNTITGDLLVYAGHGQIVLENNINLKEVTGYKIRLKNTAEVIYETGIANLVFDSGPSGSYDILSWRETE